MSNSEQTPPLTAVVGWPHCFSLLKRQGFEPRCILDVGANHGRWTREAVVFFPTAEYILVEPQGHLRASVRDLVAQGIKIQWLPVGVGDVPGRSLFTVAPDDVSSNFGMSAEQAAAYGYAQATVDVMTIDQIVAQNGGRVPELVKIDAEGMELRVLEGAASVLARSEVIFVEAGVCAAGIPNTVSAVISRMDKAGYQLFDITELNRSPRHGVLWLVELVFLAKSSRLLSKFADY